MMVIIRATKGKKRTLKLVEVWLYAHRKTVGLLGAGAQDGHLDFHTAPEL